MAADLELIERVFLAGYPNHFTRATYACDLHQWAAWLKLQDVDLLEAQRGHVQVWTAELADLGRAPGTVARKLSAISAYYRILVIDGALTANPVAHVRRPKVSQESTRSGLDLGEWRRLAATARAAGPLEHALVMVLGHNGLRISSACRIKVGDLYVAHNHDCIRIVAKGGKTLVVPFADSTAAAVHRLAEHDHLKPGDRLLRINRFQAGRIVVRLVKAAGITDKRITCHSLRHTFVTLALESGAPLHHVQAAAGHASPVTTQRYDRARRRLEDHVTFGLADFLADPEPENPEPDQPHGAAA